MINSSFFSSLKEFEMASELAVRIVEKMKARVKKPEQIVVPVVAEKSETVPALRTFGRSPNLGLCLDHCLNHLSRRSAKKRYR